MQKERDGFVDIVRGIAILMVIFGHTISNNNIIEYENSFLFKIVFSLQMPLFMLISGYCTKFSKKIDNINDYMCYLAKRTLTYILPFFVWTIIKYLVSFNSQNVFQYLLSLAYNMDSGYWFLFSLWSICLIFGTSSYIGNKIKSNDIVKVLIICVLNIIMLVPLLILAKYQGINFLGIKYTAYYILFFLVGYIFVNLKDRINVETYKKIEQITFLICLCAYFVLSVFFNVYLIGETIIELIIRFSLSITGCVVLIVFLNSIREKITKSKFLIMCGRESLGIYVIHSFFLNLMQLPENTFLFSSEGLLVSIVNFVVCVAISSLIVCIININKLTKLIFFGKKK